MLSFLLSLESVYLERAIPTYPVDQFKLVVNCFKEMVKEYGNPISSNFHHCIEPDLPPGLTNIQKFNTSIFKQLDRLEEQTDKYKLDWDDYYLEGEKFLIKQNKLFNNTLTNEIISSFNEAKTIRNRIIQEKEDYEDYDYTEHYHALAKTWDLSEGLFVRSMQEISQYYQDKILFTANLMKKEKEETQLLEQINFLDLGEEDHEHLSNEDKLGLADMILMVYQRFAQILV